MATIKGTIGDDTLTGSTSADYIIGRRGDDVLYGLAGSDLLVGGAGNDTLSSGNVVGSVGYSDEGNDTLRGGAGNDLLVAGLGNNIVKGGAGDDRLSGSGMLMGGAGDDTIWGAYESDIRGDVLRGGAGNDVLSTNHNDRVDGGSGFDTMALRYTIEGAHYERFFDFTSKHAGQFTNIERIDMSTANRPHRLILGEKELLALSPTTDTLIVDSRPGYVAAIDIVGDFTDEGIHDGYHRYQVGAATLLVDTDITNVS
jgi:Ca2+-binding RTX toxin-like protein